MNNKHEGTMGLVMAAIGIEFIAIGLRQLLPRLS